MLPQLIRGSLDDVTISSDDVELDAFAGDVTVHAQDIAIRGDAGAGSASATVVLDEEQLRTLLSTVENFPTESLGLAEPNLTMSTELSLFGITLPVGVALTPSAVDGAIVLTPASLQLAGSDISAAALERAVRRPRRHRPARLDDLRRPVHPGGRDAHRHRRDRRPGGRRPGHQPRDRHRPRPPGGRGVRVSSSASTERGMRRVMEAECGIWRALDFWEPPGA